MFGSAFLFDVLGEIGDLVVQVFDFAGEMDILRVSGVRLEECVSFGFQIVAFLFPKTCGSNHVMDLGISVHPFFALG